MRNSVPSVPESVHSDGESKRDEERRNETEGTGEKHLGLLREELTDEKERKDNARMRVHVKSLLLMFSFPSAYCTLHPSALH